MKTVFIVVGTTGEYSDRNEWFVAAYADREKAETHAQLAKARAMELEPTRSEWAYEKDQPKNAWDPDMHMDYTGTDYSVAEVPMLRAVPRPEPS